MTNSSRPTSRVIEISSIAPMHPDNYTPDRVVTALCEDGSIWERLGNKSDWLCILEPHQPSPAKGNVPMPGSRWRAKGHKSLVVEVIKNNGLLMKHCDEAIDSAKNRFDMTLEYLEKYYEPLPKEQDGE